MDHRDRRLVLMALGIVLLIAGIGCAFLGLVDLYVLLPLFGGWASLVYCRCWPAWACSCNRRYFCRRSVRRHLSENNSPTELGQTLQGGPGGIVAAHTVHTPSRRRGR